MVFEQPDVTILSGHVDGKDIKDLHSHIRVEIISLPSKVETIFLLPISNYFQVKDLPKGKHLVQLRSTMPSSTYKFESEVVEVDLESQPQIHVGPLSYRIVEDIYKQVISPCLWNLKSYCIWDWLVCISSSSWLWTSEIVYESTFRYCLSWFSYLLFQSWRVSSRFNYKRRSLNLSNTQVVMQLYYMFVMICMFSGAIATSFMLHV